MTTVSLRIKGKVQGVGFRYFVLHTAKQLGVNGYVKNCANGDVYLEAEADEATLLIFIEQCRGGPQRSKVEDMFVTALSDKGFSSFNIYG